MQPSAQGFRRWFAVALGTTIVLAATVIAFNAWVDPFQHYHVAGRFPPRFYTLHHRFIDPGLARNARYDVLVSGSSIMENARNDVTARACGGAAVNVAMPAMSAAERRLIIDLALRGHGARRVVAVLDFNEFAGAPDARQDVAGPLPRYLYDDNPFNDLPYVLSFDVLRKSWAIFRDAPDGEFRTDATAPWFWAPRKTFGRAQVVRDLDLANINARFQQPPRTLAGMQASFERNLLPLIAAHPETRFELVWPPYSILVWLDFTQRDQLEVTLAFKRYVRAATLGHPNVRIHDLQAARAITHDLDRYTDLYHFDPAVNDLIVKDACAESADTDASLAQKERELRDQLRAIGEPGAVEALARPSP